MKKRKRKRFGTKVKRRQKRTSTTPSPMTDGELRTLIEGVFQDLDEMDSIVASEKTTTTTTQPPLIGILLTPSETPSEMDEGIEVLPEIEEEHYMDWETLSPE